MPLPSQILIGDNEATINKQRKPMHHLNLIINTQKLLDDEKPSQSKYNNRFILLDVKSCDRKNRSTMISEKN